MDCLAARRARRVLPLLLGCCVAAAGAVSLDGKRIRVACVGASITEGFMSTPGHDYPSQLHRLLGGGFEVRNFGKTGRTAIRQGKVAAGFFGRFGDASYQRTQEFKDAVAFLPDIVVLQFGANDSRDCNWKHYNMDFVADYSDLISKFEELGSHPTVYVMEPPPLYNDGAYGMNATVVNRLIPGQLSRLAQQKGLPPTAKVYSAFMDHCPLPQTQHCDWMSVDGVHPNDAGYAQIARVVAEGIRASRGS